MISRRGLLAGLLAIPVAKCLEPLGSLFATLPSKVTATGSLPSSPTIFDLSDPEIIIQWERSLMAVASQRSPLFDPEYGLGVRDGS